MPAVAEYVFGEQATERIARDDSGPLLLAAAPQRRYAGKSSPAKEYAKMEIRSWLMLTVRYA